MKNKKVIIGLATAFLFIVAIFNIKEYKSDTITSGVIYYNTSNFKTIAMYKNDGGSDEEITTMPEGGYTINTEKSYCTVDNINKVYNKMYTNEEGNHIITGLSKDSKCYIYFDKKTINGSSGILSNLTVNEGTPNFGKTSCSSGCGETTVGLYKSQDDDGDTYYFRGDVENNYVKFADKYWRIIRINGDGTIRLIYDGTRAHTNGQIGQSESDSIAASNVKFSHINAYFNSSSDNAYVQDNMYVGFRYSSGLVHGLGTKSNILQQLENWYNNNNLANYETKLDGNTGFCGDRTPYSNQAGTISGGGTGQTVTWYGWVRLISKKEPRLTDCSNEDLYTTIGATKGNKSLEKPIGLITADEVALAGGVNDIANSKYYLYNVQQYWTMSPQSFNGTGASIFYITSIGALSNDFASSERGVRPVINLKSDVQLTGTGTASDPYVVV